MFEVPSPSESSPSMAVIAAAGSTRPLAARNAAPYGLRPGAEVKLVWQVPQVSKLVADGYLAVTAAGRLGNALATAVCSRSPAATAIKLVNRNISLLLPFALRWSASRGPPHLGAAFTPD